MTQWKVTTAYKYDLASVCNLFTQAENIVALHQEAYSEFEHKILARPDLISVAKTMYNSGFDPRLVLISMFDMNEYMGNDIEALTDPFTKEDFRKRLKDYYVLEAKLVTEAVWENVAKLIPVLCEMATYLHKEGFKEYWHKKCLPILKVRCAEYQKQAQAYPIIEEINNFLGREYQLSDDEVTLYVSMLSAPFGTSLRQQAFISDQRWDIETTVAIALHELMHPPFSRDFIGSMAELLCADDFFQEAYSSQPSTTAYNTPLRFLEENLVEAAHVYLAQKLGALEDPLKYFITHDGGTHVVSAIIFDKLLKTTQQNTANYETTVRTMIKESVLEAGNLRQQYLQVYQEAGLASEHPYRQS